MNKELKFQSLFSGLLFKSEEDGGNLADWQERFNPFFQVFFLNLLKIIFNFVYILTVSIPFFRSSF